MSKNLNSLIATAGGIGYLPLAPGTWAAGALTIIWFLICKNSSELFLWQLIAVPIIIAAGIYCSGKILTAKVKDPSYVVIDEVAGMAVTLFLIPASWQNFFVGFILFRFFDILKPLGIKRTEKLKNGWGIMFDDILAGIYSTLLLRLLIFLKIW